MNSQRILREQLKALLQGGNAHLPFSAIVQAWPPDRRGAKHAILPYTPWQILEHLRIAQWDILEFSRNPRHVSPDWPAGFWPKADAPKDEREWDEAVADFKKQLGEMIELVMDETTDLLAKIPHGEGQTLLREALLLADHNAYHLGQLALLKKALGAWTEAG